MQKMLSLLIIMLILRSILPANELLEKEKAELFELCNLHDYSLLLFYDMDSWTIEQLEKIKLLTKKILKGDPDYEFYRDVILLYAFVCDGLNYQYYLRTMARRKPATDVDELFDLDEFEEPLQWLILGHYFTWIKIWGNKTFGRIKTEDGLKYFNKIIKKYPDSQYIDDAYLGMGDYYSDIGFYGRRINIPEVQQMEYIKRSIKIYEDILKKYPDSNSALITSLHLFREYRIHKQKAEEFINKCIAEYRKKGKTEAVVRLLKRKVSMCRMDKSKQDEVIQILEEIESMTKYKSMKREAEGLLIDKYKQEGKYDKLLRLYERLLNEAEADEKKIKDYKEWIEKIKKMK